MSDNKSLQDDWNDTAAPICDSCEVHLDGSMVCHPSYWGCPVRAEERAKVQEARRRANEAWRPEQDDDEAARSYRSGYADAMRLNEHTLQGVIDLLRAEGRS